MTDTAMPLAEFARRRGLSPDRIRKKYAAYVAAGMPRRLPGPEHSHWKFPRAAAEAWLAGVPAPPLAANDDTAIADPIAATRAALAAAYGTPAAHAVPPRASQRSTG